MEKFWLNAIISTHFDAVKLDAETDQVLEWWGFVENLEAKRASSMLPFTEIWGKMSSFEQIFFDMWTQKRNYFKSNHRRRLAVVKLRTLVPIPFGVFRFLSLFVVKSFGLLPLLYSKLRKTPDNWLLLKIPKIIQATQFHLTFWWYKLRILVIISFSFLLQLAYFTFLPVWLSL